MTAKVIDGKAAAARLRAQVTEEVARLGEKGLRPGLATVLVGDDPASEVYVRNKGRQSQEAGIASFQHRLDANAPEDALLALVGRLNLDREVHGILVQLPLPQHMAAARVIEAIDPAKDVDAFTSANAGRLATGQPALLPCTPLGCLLLLRERHASLEGLEAVVVGRSNIVGKPMAQLLLQEGATVTIAHSRTRDLASVTRRGDILIAAVGRAGLIGAAHVRAGATVIDVGINRVPGPDGRSVLTGDVDFAAVSGIAGAITPVPGGVGPMTIACLLANTVTAACRRAGLPEPRLFPS